MTRGTGFSICKLLVAHGAVDGLAILLLIEPLMHPHVLVSIQLLFDPNPDTFLMEQMFARSLHHIV